MRSRSAFTILEALITMGVLLTSLLIIMGLMTRFMIISEYSLAAVNLSDELLKAAMKVRGELLKIGPRADKVSLYQNGVEAKGVEGDEVRFDISVLFGEKGSYYSTAKYSIKFDKVGKRVVIAEVQEQGNKLNVLRVLAENIEDCRFRKVESNVISFSLQKREKRISRSIEMAVSLLNTK